MISLWERISVVIREGTPHGRETAPAANAVNT